MKVICDNCRAVYKIPDEKLVKPVNKATCRQCGHRMLIPRPRMDADPDERTLVTAVPPTPAPAPPRASFDDDPPTNPMGRNPERTIPSTTKEVDLHTATPSPARSSRGAKPRMEPKAAQPTRPARVPAHENAHDPAKDMSFVCSGVLLALAGAVVLAVIPLVQHLLPPFLAPITVSGGLMVAAGGALLALLIMVTGSRGRKPANPFLSFILAGGLAFLIGLIPIVVAAMSVTSDNPTAPETTHPTESETVADAPADKEVVPDNSTGDDTEAETKPVATTTKTTPPTRPVTKPNNRTRTPTNNTPRTTPPRTPPPAPKDRTPAGGTNFEEDLADDELDLPDDILDDEPEPPKTTTSTRRSTAPTGGGTAPPPKSDLPTKPAIGAIDVMVKSNISVKKCFFKHQSSKGSLPPRIDVRFTIRPDGSATKVGIKQVEYAASDLDFCLGSAIKGIKFPPSQDGVSLTFPFQFS